MTYSVTEQVVRWLNVHGYRASTRPPADAPDAPAEFVTVERTGGYVENMIDHPVMAIQSWAQTEARAEEMSNAIRNLALLSERPRGVHRMDVESGPYPFYDEGTRCPRYQLVLDVTCRLTD